MATRKFLYTDANADYLESAGAYETADFISTSSGSGDAGKPIVLDSNGKIDGSMVATGVAYTVAAGGVTKGDLLYISAADTAGKKDITTSTYAIGLAASTESAAATVYVVAENYVITGALTAATAGDRYYWNGTALTTTIPSTSGNYVWLCGVAKNATDLDVHVEFIKKNV